MSFSFGNGRVGETPVVLVIRDGAPAVAVGVVDGCAFMDLYDQDPAAAEIAYRSLRPLEGGPVVIR